VCDFLYKSSALALNFSILLYILYNREPLGIFSHVQHLRGAICDPWLTRKPEDHSRLLKKASECFDTLSTNGKFSIISSAAPFALSLSKGERWLFSAAC